MISAGDRIIFLNTIPYHDSIHQLHTCTYMKIQHIKQNRNRISKDYKTVGLTVGMNARANAYHARRHRLQALWLERIVNARHLLSVH